MLPQELTKGFLFKLFIQDKVNFWIKLDHQKVPFLGLLNFNLLLKYL